MPSIDVKTLKLDRPTKDLIAEKLFEGAKKVLRIPSWEVYFNEYDSYYAQGKPAPSNLITIIVDGPDNLEKETLANLCSTLTEAVKTVIPDPAVNVLFMYDGHDREHVGHNGKILARLSPRQHLDSRKSAGQ